MSLDNNLSVLYRVLPVIGLLITTAISIALFDSNLSQRISTGSLYVWVTNNRVEANIIVNVLAQLLAFVQLFALCSIINYSTRSSLPSRPVSLDTLKFWNALSVGRIDWSLSSVLLSLAIAFSIFTLLPSIGWVAAITPSFITTNVTTVISVPIYTPDPYELYWNLTWDPFRETNMTFIGNDAYSFIPGAAAGATLMNSAATASSHDSNPRTHRKSDGSVYSYVGRSYGLGAPVGLANLTSPVRAPYSAYVYNETGYRTAVSCVYNQSSDWVLKDAELNGGALPDILMAQGILTPGNDPDRYAVVGFGGNRSIVALIAGGANNTNNIAITAGTDYTHLDKIQCATKFNPFKFSVTINRNGRNITVTPLGPDADIDPSSPSEPDQRGRLQQAALWEITRLSQRNVNLYSSTIGDSLESNIARWAGVSSSAKANDKQRLDAVAESFQAIIDDILLSISSAQYMIGPKDSRKETSVDMAVAAVVIGTRRGIISIFIGNAVLILICLVECIRTRFWSRTPAWDYRDLTDVVVGASRGGPAIATALKRWELRQRTGVSSRRVGQYSKIEESSFGSSNKEPKVQLVTMAREQDALVYAADSKRFISQQADGTETQSFELGSYSSSHQHFSSIEA